jgi:hypothetical protein
VQGRLGRNADFSAEITTRLRTFQAAELAARQAAAQTATRVTRQLATRTRPRSLGRPGRPVIDLAQQLRWLAGTGIDSNVRFDFSTANKGARFWIIQEIGTNASAEMRIGAEQGSTPYARQHAPVKRQQISGYVRTVKAQKGRYIGRKFGRTSGLAFGTVGGKYMEPSRRRTDQIFETKDLEGAPYYHNLRITIQREIKGKQMVKQGAEKGFLQYQNAVLAAARQLRQGFNP